MKLTDAQELTLDRYLSAIETGDPDGDYSNVTILSDNPRGNPQITYGKHQTTEAGKNLQKLVKNYLKRESPGMTATNKARLEAFVTAPQYSTTGDRQLKAVLKRLGDDPVMQDIQNEFFLEHYMAPARKWAEDNGFTTPLSMLVIYDSFIQSGGIPSWIRKRFRASPPAAGGDEKKWISAYVDARHQWLKNWGDGKSNKSRAIRNSRYRTEGLNNETDSDNWFLTGPLSVNGIKVQGGVQTQPTPCDKCSGSGYA